MNNNLLSSIRALTQLNGPPGQEEEIRDYIIKNVKEYADIIEVDHMGNLIVGKGLTADYKIAIVSHMDEVSLIVKNIENNGVIRFEKSGMIDDRVLPGREVNIISLNGLKKGVIGTKSRHLLSEEEMQKNLSYKQMWIDVGASSRKAIEEMGITVGCGICFATGFCELADGSLLSKALDDRIGCAVMSETFRLVAERGTRGIDTYLIGTVQEEIGARGAAIAAFDLKPDLAIVLDTVPVEDPVVSSEQQTVKINQGPVIRIFDIHSSLKGAISNPVIVKRLIEVAEKKEIPYQKDVLSGTFLDSTTLQMTGGGIPVGSICFPRKYSHSPTEIASINDAEDTVKLLVAFIESLAEERLIFGEKIK